MLDKAKIKAHNMSDNTKKEVRAATADCAHVPVVLVCSYIFGYHGACVVDIGHAEDEA